MISAFLYATMIINPTRTKKMAGPVFRNCLPLQLIGGPSARVAASLCAFLGLHSHLGSLFFKPQLGDWMVISGSVPKT